MSICGIFVSLVEDLRESKTLNNFNIPMFSTTKLIKITDDLNLLTDLSFFHKAEIRIADSRSDFQLQILSS